MSVAASEIADRLAEFVSRTEPPADARLRAADAFCDTIGVTLAGVLEPATRIALRATVAESHGQCRLLGTTEQSGAAGAAFVNGVAAHALDYDDMCFVSMAHPSCALVPAILAAAELTGAPGRTALDAYVAGFEVECRLGAVMNPRHYHQRGWHATSTIGTVGAAAAAARVLGLDVPATAHALGIAASSACGFKENLGAMVKPLHAGLAASNGLRAARLAADGFVASARALDGPQGYLVVMDSEHAASALARAGADLGRRWEILETGISVKLYPSCAATHPPLDALLHLKQLHGFMYEDVEAVAIVVDRMTPRLLIYPRPATGLEAKFSIQFCAAAAIVFGHPTVDTFDLSHIADPRIQDLMGRVTMTVDPAFDSAAPLSQARVRVTLCSGLAFEHHANGARGYPGRLTAEDLSEKFLQCAGRTLSPARAADALAAVQGLLHAGDVNTVTARCIPD